MNIRKFIIALLVCLAAGLPLIPAAGAQNVQGVIRKLAVPDPTNRADVAVTQHGDLAEIVSGMEAVRKPDKISGYRVRIFFDNSQYARERAQHARSRFAELYPGIPVYMNYENPYFKVSVGNCVTNEEAITLWGRVKKDFETAFVTVDQIQVKAVAESPERDAPPAERP